MIALYNNTKGPKYGPPCDYDDDEATGFTSDDDYYDSELPRQSIQTTRPPRAVQSSNRKWELCKCFTPTIHIYCLHTAIKMFG